MAWFKVDDGFWAHPKTVSLSGDAVALWLRGGTWSASQLTDGFVPAKILPLLQADESAAHELVEAELWEEMPGGWGFHDWERYQPTREQVEAKRDAVSAKRAEAGRKGAESRWRNGKNGKSMANGWQDDGKAMAPSRPVPSRPEVLTLNGHLQLSNARETKDDDQSMSAEGILARYGISPPEIAAALGVDVEPMALLVAWDQIMREAKGPIRSPQAYLLECIRQTPERVHKLILEAS